MPSMNVDHVKFQAELSSLELMIDWVRQHIDKAGFSSQDSRKIELVMEEALVNIIRHGYQGKPGSIEISALPASPKGLIFIIKDRGSPFNPLLQVPEITPPVSLEEKKEGGLGILLICRYMDEVRYERQDPFNILTLIKYIHS